MAERIEIQGSGGQTLVARLEEPVGPVRAWAVFAHCFTCSKDLRSVRTLSRALSEKGFGVLRFDFTGLGESEGDFAETSFSTNLDDLVAAADWLRRERAAPQLLVGHSLGGAAVLAVAERLEEVVAVATIGAPSEPSHVKHSVLSGVDPCVAEAEVDLAGRTFRIKKQFFDDLEEHRLLDTLPRLRRKALLIMHSPIDEVVSVDHARQLYEAARHPKSFVALDGADHLLLEDDRDARFAADVLASWAGRYVGEGEEQQDTEREEQPALEDGTVEVVGGAEGFLNVVRTPNHELLADEPKSVGGTDQGPNPYELLLAALGTCTSMTLRMYANRKQWPLAGTRVRLKHSRVHAKDCEDCESASGTVDIIERELEILGDELDGEQRARIREIADKCPVHRTLTSETKIVDA